MLDSLEKKNIAKISLIVVMRMLGLFMLFPVFSIYANFYDNVTPLMIGLAIGIYGLTQALFQIPLGVLSDKYGRKVILLIGLSLFIIGSLIASLATDITTVIIGRFVQGLGAVSSVLMALLADVVNEKFRPRANAIIGVQIGVAFMVAILIAPIITSYFGINGLFWFIFALAIIAFMVATTLKHKKPITQYNFNLSTIKTILILPLLRLNISVFLLHLVLTSTFVVMPIIWLENSVVVTIEQWHIYLPVMLISFILMVPFIIAIEKYQKIKLTFNIAIIFIIISSYIFYQYNITFMLSVILLIIFFTGFNTLEAILPSLVVKKINSDKRGLAMGFHSSLQFLGAFAGGTLAGILYGNFGLNSVFLANTIIGLIWLLFIILTGEKQSPILKE